MYDETGAQDVAPGRAWIECEVPTIWRDRKVDKASLADAISINGTIYKPQLEGLRKDRYRRLALRRMRPISEAGHEFLDEIKQMLDSEEWLSQ